MEIHPKSKLDERSTEAYNEEGVSSPERLAELEQNHPYFEGDWAHLERIEDFLNERQNTSDPDQSLINWNDWYSQLLEQEYLHLEGAFFRKSNHKNVISETLTQQETPCGD